MDVVAYEGDGNSSTTVSHNLGVAPQLIIAKPRSASGSWLVVSAGPSGTMSDCTTGFSLDTDNAALVTGTDYSAYHTDEVFAPYRNISWDGVNGHKSGVDHIAYLFASVPGISKVGSYTGDGQLRYIDCGFDPSGHSTRGLLIKRVDSTGDWAWHYPHNGSPLGNRLHLNDTSAGVRQYDLGAGFGGFQIQPTSPYNIDGAEYIYYAISV